MTPTGATDPPPPTSHRIGNTVTAPHYLFRLADGVRSGDAGRIAIETALAERHPVAIGIADFAALQRLDAAHAVITAGDVAGARSIGRHMVLALGYDARGVRIQKSWGTDWRRGGFATLSWDFIDQHGSEASWIRGFSRDLPATPPAQVDGFSPRVYNVGTYPGHIGASWHGTGAYDSIRHPVAGHVATLTGSDGSSRTDQRVATDPNASWTSFLGLQWTWSTRSRSPR